VPLISVPAGFYTFSIVGAEKRIHNEPTSRQPIGTSSPRAIATAKEKDALCREYTCQGHQGGSTTNCRGVSTRPIHSRWGHNPLMSITSTSMFLDGYPPHLCRAEQRYLRAKRGCPPPPVPRLRLRLRLRLCLRLHITPHSACRRCRRRCSRPPFFRLSVTQCGPCEGSRFLSQRICHIAGSRSQCALARRTTLPKLLLSTSTPCFLNPPALNFRPLSSRIEKIGGGNYDDRYQCGQFELTTRLPGSSASAKFQHS
jgi:hypothetical protein